MASAPEVRRLLIIDQDPARADRLRDVLESRRRPAFRIAHTTHLPDALTLLKVSPADLLLVGTPDGDVAPEDAVDRLGRSFPEIPVLGLLTQRDVRVAERLREAGVRELLVGEDLDSELCARTIEFCLREHELNVELAESRARYDLMLHTDPLTGLLNRKGLERVLIEELASSREKDEGLPVLLIDLDDFSRVSATLGHGVGDLVLVSAARRIGETIGTRYPAGRCGIDRFVVVLPDIEVGEAETVAEQIRLGISRDVIQAGEHYLSTTASLGLIAITPDTISFDEVLSKAHFVLQCSKLEGKNRVTRAATLDEVGMIRPVEEGPDMVQALLRGDVFRIHSQPIVNLVDGRIASREMLVRGPEGPLKSPDNLFRYCQEMDILTAVDLRCLKKCSAAAEAMTALNDYHVNIMPATLLQTPPEELIRVLRGAGGTAQCCLEISEQQLLGDAEVLVPAVRILQKAGVRIAIDDVGFGNSCLEGLIVLRPQIMKVDKKMVQGLATDAGMRFSLCRLLKVAEALGADVVAEGIETGEDYQALLELGVKYGQGYLFGRPEACGQMRPRARRAAAGGQDAATFSEPPHDYL